jgi:hypothetical protein
MTTLLKTKLNENRMIEFEKIGLLNACKRGQSLHPEGRVATPQSENTTDKLAAAGGQEG